MIYDYSGSSRPGSSFDPYLVTDRGISAYELYRLRLMNYAFPNKNEYTISYWFLTRPETSHLSIIFNHDFGLIQVYRSLDKIEFIASTNLKSGSISNLSGWNLHTANMWIDADTPTRVHFNLYRNLVNVYYNFLDLTVAYIQITSIYFINVDPIQNLGSILYEMWIHTGLVDIQELSSFISTSTSC